jgi:hypothetical protein
MSPESRPTAKPTSQYPGDFFGSEGSVSQTGGMESKNANAGCPLSRTSRAAPQHLINPENAGEDAPDDRPRDNPLGPLATQH